MNLVPIYQAEKSVEELRAWAKKQSDTYLAKAESGELINRSEFERLIAIDFAIAKFDSAISTLLRWITNPLTAQTNKDYLFYAYDGLYQSYEAFDSITYPKSEADQVWHPAQARIFSAYAYLKLCAKDIQTFHTALNESAMERRDGQA